MVGDEETPSGQSGIPKPELNLEMGQYLAQKCAQSADDIVGVVEKIEGKEKWIFPHRFNDKLTIGNVNPERGKLDLIGKPDRIKGIGDHLYEQHFVNFDYDRKELQPDLKETFGVDTPLMLSVSFHTDEATMPRIEEHVRRGGTVEFIYTRYYFDHQGNYAKTICLPNDWEDPRPEISRNNWYKTLRADMTPEDFELIGGTLEFLKGELTKPSEDFNGE